MTNVKALIVSVDYGDYLQLTLPYNHHLFDRILIVSAPHDKLTHQVCAQFGRDTPGKVGLMITDAFYEGGASFNKYRAVEQGLDLLGREGWLSVMDADILIPKGVQVKHDPWYGPDSLRITDTTNLNPSINKCSESFILHPGTLFTPLRRMCTITGKVATSDRNPTSGNPLNHDPSNPVVNHLTNSTGANPTNPPTNNPIFPPESEWSQYPVHPNQGEWAGYMHLFHATDPVLTSLPWYETDWKHAGGADSMFQKKWLPKNKMRPNWEVLHIGNAGMNWCGRTSDYLDGTKPEDAQDKLDQLRRMMMTRRQTRSFQSEKLG